MADKIYGVERMVLDLAELSGDDLVVRTQAVTSAEPCDITALEHLCHEIEGRIERGDLMIGILPLTARETMARGYAALASTGRAAGWLRLGVCYLEGHLVEPVTWPQAYPFADPDTESVGAALRCFAEAARLGDSDAAMLFAQVSRDGSTAAKEAALHLLGPLCGDDPSGGFRYQRGLVQYWLGRIPDAAISHRQAAEAGNADAMFELYVLQATSQISDDSVGARQWLERAGEHGQPRALYNLGAAYATGDGYDRNPARAAECYRKAAEAGHAKAALALGVMHLLGDGVAADSQAAAELFELAEDAADGHIDVDEFLDGLGLQRPL